MCVFIFHFIVFHTPTHTHTNERMSEFGSQQVRIESRSGRGGRAGRAHAFTCSAQSILSAMDSFVQAVSQMNDTILVPSRLRDMQLRDELCSGLASPSPNGQFRSASDACNNRSSSLDTTANGRPHATANAASSNMTGMSGSLALLTRRLKRPAPLLNCDLFAFYSMLDELRKELLWGPASGQSTIYTHSYPQMLNTSSTPPLQGNGSSSSIVAGSGSGSPCPPLPSTVNPMSHGLNGSQASLNSLFCQSWRQSSLNLSCSNVKSVAGLRRCESSSVASSSGVSSICSSTSGSIVPNSTSSLLCSLSTSANAGNLTCNNIAGNSNSAISSSQTLTTRESVQKLNQKLLECDLDSELDYMSTDRTDCCAEQSLHLASAFKHHLQGLHTILQQLTSSADYLTRNYQLEVDEQ